MDGNTPSTDTTPTYPRMAYAIARVWPDNPRKVVTGIDELAASIAKSDIIEPLVVRALPAPVDGFIYEVLAGQRRYLAGQKAGLKDFPYLVRQLDDAEALEIALVENNQRVDPSPLEDAEALDRRIHDAKSPCTAEYLADRLGRRVEWVKGRLALLALCDDAKGWMRAGRLPLAHAQRLATVDVATQRRVMERFERASELPAAKAFALEITYALHLIGSAPFDAADAKLPGGACAKCPKRSDTQPDLFDTGRGETGAHCLDNTCWDGKVTAIWERAQKSAAKRHLEVITATDVARDGYHDQKAVVDWNQPYTTTAPTPDAKPVAVARTPRGVVVELYAKPTREDTDDDAVWTARQAEHDAKRKAEEAKELETARRVFALLADHRPLFERLAIHGCVCAFGTASLRLALTAAGIAFPADKRDATLVGHIPESELARVLVAWLALDYLRDSDAADDTLACERTARALVAGETPAEALTRVWILEEEWDALSENGREAYTIPDVGQEIRWDGREGAVTAVVPAEWLTYLRTMAAEDGITLHEGEESPVKAATKPSKKPRKKTTKPTTEAPVPGAEVAAELRDLGREHGITDEVVERIAEEIAPTVSETPAADEPTTPRPGELLFFKGEDTGRVIGRITATHLVVDIGEMAFEVSRDTISWRDCWETSVKEPETTTLRVSAETWQKHKSGLGDTSTGALHKRWLSDGDQRVVTFVTGTGGYEKIIAYVKKHGIELFNGDRRVSPEEETFAAAKKRTKKGAK